MNGLNFPAYQIKVQRSESGFTVFDFVRMKWVKLTPEEWVRQHVLHWLVETKGYPAGRIAVEKQLLINGTMKRYDAVVFDENASPAILIECKSPDVALTESVFDQTARYNLLIDAPLLFITNGNTHFCACPDHENRKWIFLKELPDFVKT